MRPATTTIRRSLLATLFAASAFAQPEVDFITRFTDATNGWIQDIYATADGGYVITGFTWEGQANYQDNERNLWVAKLNEDLEVVWMAGPDLAGTGEDGYTIIEADNGDFIIGGIKQNQDDRPDWESAICRLSAQGERIWFRAYGHRSFQAVIELKGGNFVACGGGNGEDAGGGQIAWGRVMCFNGDGDAIWDVRVSGAGDFPSPGFYTMRETDGGIVLAGRVLRRAGVVGDSRVFAAKLNFDGEILWTHNYGGMGYRQTSLAMISAADGGFWLAGEAADTLFRNRISGDFLLMKINSEGERQNFHRYHIPWDVGQQLMQSTVYSIAKFEDGTMALIGEQVNTDIGRRPTVIHVTANGEELWRQVFQMHDFDELLHENGSGFNAGIRAHDGAILCAGRTLVLDDVQHWEGLIVKYEPIAMDNRILEYLPVDLDLTVLVGDTVSFGIRPVGAWGGADSVGYLWTLDDNDTLGREPAILVEFDERRDYQVKGEVFIGDTSAAVVWDVRVVDLFIADYSPDTLSLAPRRGSAQTFSIDSVTALPGEAVQYQWTMTNTNNFESDGAGTDSRSTIPFLQSGNYAVQGLVCRGESSDAVVWNIAVRGVIWSFQPETLLLAVPVGEQVRFEVISSNPDTGQIAYSWVMDGEVAGDDSSLVIRFDREGDVLLTGIATEGAEADSIVWRIDVTPLGIMDKMIGQAGMHILLSVMPNPFNSTTRIRYSLPVSGEVRLSMVDLRGREIEMLFSGQQETGEHFVAFDGSGLPAGIYFARLAAEGSRQTVKVVVVR